MKVYHNIACNTIECFGFQSGFKIYGALLIKNNMIAKEVQPLMQAITVNCRK